MPNDAVPNLVNADLPNIGFLGAAAGAGKTYGAVRQATTWARQGQNTLMVQPSIRLIEQTVAAFHARQVEAHAIHGGRASDVVRQIDEVMLTAKCDGRVLIITHAAFDRLAYANRELWHLIHDEVPTVDYHRHFILRDNGWLLLNHLISTDTTHGYAPLLLAEAADRVLAGRDDEVWDLVHEPLTKLAGGQWKLWANAEQLNRFKGKRGASLDLFGLRNSNAFVGWRSATIMAAALPESLMYRLWDKQVVWTTTPIHTRFTLHDNGKFLSIYYLTERHWSKVLRDTQVVGGSVLDVLIARTLKVFADGPFCWMANLDVRDGTLPGIRLPNTTHGLNSYSHIDRVVVLSALNPQPAHIRFLHEVAGIDSEGLRDAGYRAAVYQAVGRISLRNPKSTTHKLAVVADRPTAKWLARAYPGAEVLPLGDDPLPQQKHAGRPRAHESPAARAAAYRARKRGSGSDTK